jgi:transcriptional regulator with GAF, ATPase, and Fis domain
MQKHCTIEGCSLSFKSVQGLKVHLSRKHSSHDKFEEAMNVLNQQSSVLLSCEFCKLVLSTKYNLEKHLTRCKTKKSAEDKKLRKTQESKLIARIKQENKTALLEKDKELQRLKTEMESLMKQKELEAMLYKREAEIHAEHIEDLKQIIKTTQQAGIE